MPLSIGMKTVEIKKVTTGEENVSARTVSYDIYVDGKYETTRNDVIEALETADSLRN